MMNEHIASRDHPSGDSRGSREDVELADSLDDYTVIPTGGADATSHTVPTVIKSTKLADIPLRENKALDTPPQVGER